MTLCAPNRFKEAIVFPVAARSDKGKPRHCYVMEQPMHTCGTGVGEFLALGTARWTNATTGDIEIQNAVAKHQRQAEARVWTVNLLTSPTAPARPVDIYQTVRSVKRAIANFGVRAVDLTSIEVASAHPKHLLAVLTASFPWRDVVPGWQEALAVAPAVLEAQGMNPKRELAGLYD